MGATMGRILAGRLFGTRAFDYCLAGIVISRLAFLLAMVLLHRLALLDVSAQDAERAVWYAAIFPFAFFCGVVAALQPGGGLSRVERVCELCRVRASAGHSTVRVPGRGSQRTVRSAERGRGALAITAIPFVWQRLGAAYALFMVINLYVPLSTGQFEGLGRCSTVLFPIF